MADNKAQVVTTGPDKAPSDKILSTVNFRVEMGDAKNRNFVWPLDSRLLRGRFSRSNILNTVLDERFSEMPDIPGVLVEINGNRNSLYLMDPMAHPANKAVFDKVKSICDRFFAGNSSYDFQPTGVLAFRDLTQDEFKSACYYVRRYLDARQCTVISGSVPDMKTVYSLPGKIMFENYDSSPNADRLREPVRYIPVKLDESKSPAPIVEVDFE